MYSRWETTVWSFDHHAGTSTVLGCLYFTLTAVPFVVTVAYLLFGRTRRLHELDTYVRKSATAKDVFESKRSGKDDKAAQPADPADDESGDMPLGQYFQRQYRLVNTWYAYGIALTAFYFVYGVLVYWAFLSWGSLLTGPTTDAAPDAGLWRLVRLGGTGAFGATIAAVWHMYWRVVRLDLVPRTFFQLSARLVASPFLAIAFAALLNDAFAYLTAFFAGMYADEALRILKVKAYGGLNKVVNRDAVDGSLSLAMIQGITTDDQLRLSEEGISDVEHMAMANVLTLATNTGYSLQRIVDWKDQAYLCCYVREDVSLWRGQLIRGALDVLTMASQYYWTGGGDQRGPGTDDAEAAAAKKQGADGADVGDGGARVAEEVQGANRGVVDPGTAAAAAAGATGNPDNATDTNGRDARRGGATDRDELLQALSSALKIDRASIERLIVSVYNDNRVYQLWKLSKSFFPEDAKQQLG
jgi:hypothetical protein